MVQNAFLGIDISGCVKCCLLLSQLHCIAFNCRSTCSMKNAIFPAWLGLGRPGGPACCPPCSPCRPQAWPQTSSWCQEGSREPARSPCRPTAWSWQQPAQVLPPSWQPPGTLRSPSFCQGWRGMSWRGCWRTSTWAGTGPGSSCSSGGSWRRGRKKVAMGSPWRSRVSIKG